MLMQGKQKMNVNREEEITFKVILESMKSLKDVL